MEKLKVLSLFSGIGAFEKALEKLEIPYELVNYCEIDKYASKAYSLIHNVPENMNLGDITKINIDKLPKDIDLITHGSPCFTGDTLVLTKDGYKEIKDVKIGDEVLGHNNTYNRVVNFFDNGKKEIYKLKASSFDEIKTTENHRFYVREMNKIYDKNEKKYVKTFSNPIWKECKNLTKNDYLGIPVNTNSVLPQWNGIERIKNNKPYVINNLNMEDENLWYLCGRYVADGWLRNRKERNNSLSTVVICCGKSKIDKFLSKIGNNFPYVLTEDRSTYRLTFSNIELAHFLNQFCRGAINKKIPSFMFDMPIKYIKKFLEGYFDGDGYYNINKQIQCCSSISKQLIYGLARLIEKSYHRMCCVYKQIQSKTKIIENRIVNQNDYYYLRFRLNPKNTSYFFENDYLWIPVKSVENTGKLEEVYDIEVETDHSFTANGVIVHNCQDFSLAGLQKGGDKGTNTRSSLMWNTIDIVKETKPKVVVWENVKNLLSKKHRHNFDSYLQIMEELGYNNYYEVLNAKNYGIPQNRERVYTISIRKDIDDGAFEFPKPFKLELKLKDLLEENVDEKYFLSDKMIQRIVANNEKWSGNNNKSLINKSIASTINTGEGCRRCDASNYVAEGLPEDIDIKEAVRQGGYRQPCIFIKEKTKKGYVEAHEGDGVYINRPHQKRGVVQKDKIQTITCNNNNVGVVVLGNYSPSGHNASRVVDSEGIAPTVMENHGTVTATVVAAAQRGRGNPPKQQLEVSDREIANCITTVQKDSMVAINTLWTETQAKMITKDGDVKRYINSDVVDKFDEGDCADISFPNGYNKGNRVFKGYSPTLNDTTTKSSFIVKVKDKLGNEISLKSSPKNLVQTIEQNELPINEVRNMDLYNRNLTENSTTLRDGVHNEQRLWDGLRIRKLTPKECFRLMGFEDKDVDILIENNISNSQLYKMAGNSIVVDVLYYIFKQLYK